MADTATLSLLVKAPTKPTYKKVRSPLFPAVIGWELEGNHSEAVGWGSGYWSAENRPAGGCSYVPDLAVLAAYERVKFGSVPDHIGECPYL